jgi:osmotically-inducible protein OsmY
MITATNKSDLELKTDVLAELKYEPSVKVTDIGVQVKEGVVTLNGNVTNYTEKWNAVRATKRVAGVRAVADDIQVQLSEFLHRTDGDIAAVAANRMDWNTTIPKGAVKISVRDGHITLEGQLEWWYQRNDAENALRHLAGVKGVTNLIAIKPTITHANIESSIKAAFERNAILDAKKIQVECDGNKVTLRGKVRSYAERDEAERTAWAAPGVYSVDNHILVEWFWG